MKRYSYQKQVDIIKIQLNEGAVVPEKYDTIKPNNILQDNPGLQDVLHPPAYSGPEIGGYGWEEGQRDPRDEPLGRMREAHNRMKEGNYTEYDQARFKKASDDYNSLVSKMKTQAAGNQDLEKDIQDYHRTNVEPMGAFPWKELSGAAADLAIAYALGKVQGGGFRMPSAVRNTAPGRAISSVAGIPSSFASAVKDVAGNATQKTRQAWEDLKDKSLGVPTRSEVQASSPWVTDAANSAIRSAMRSSLPTTVGQSPTQRGVKLSTSVIDAASQHLEPRSGFEVRLEPTDPLAGTIQPLGKGQPEILDVPARKQPRLPGFDWGYERPARENDPRRTRPFNPSEDEGATTRVPYPKSGDIARTLEIGGKPTSIPIGPTHVKLPDNPTMTSTVVSSSSPRTSAPSANVIPATAEELSRGVKQPTRSGILGVDVSTRQSPTLQTKPQWKPEFPDYWKDIQTAPQTVSVSQPAKGQFTPSVPQYSGLNPQSQREVKDASTIINNYLYGTPGSRRVQVTTDPTNIYKLSSDINKDVRK